MKMKDSPLVPVPMVDKNGKTVTRWTRVLETGEPEVNIPAPKSPALSQMAETVFARLFPDIDGETGYLKDCMGARWYQSYEFCSHVISVLPPKTLKTLIEKYDYDRSAVQRYITKTLITYVGDMYENGQGEEAEKHYADRVREINNALVFFEPLMTVLPLLDYPPADDDIPILINWGVECYEGEDVNVRKYEHYSPETTVDYGAAPRRKREEAQGFFIAMFLNKHFGDVAERPAPALVKLVTENLHRQEEIRNLAQERSVKDVKLIKSILDGGEAVPLSGGML